MQMREQNPTYIYIYAYTNKNQFFAAFFLPSSETEKTKLETKIKKNLNSFERPNQFKNRTTHTHTHKKKFTHSLTCNFGFEENKKCST